MLDEYIKLFSGYDGDFGIADMSKAKLDSERNKLKPDYEWAGRPITPADYKNLNINENWTILKPSGITDRGTQ